ncbi:hypothetical protein [uncultured Cocleimonas sp.]|uniref:hypothetical protein n=1 Tax=uncultured Cocleimonas sp. TaxID=1051587 RepID=UPI0026045E97|nr:hypothetical protein [uncultured Cocleimonas sp.]
MEDSDVMFNLVFGWGMVVLAVLLVAVLVVYIKSLLVFKNAKVIKGKVIDLMDIGELNLPTIEYQLDGETLHFRSKTAIKNLVVDEDVDIEIGVANEPRIYEKNSTIKLPMVIYVIFALVIIFGIKAVAFLQSLAA